MTDDTQAAPWNDAVGEAWVRHSESYDETLAPFGHAAMDRLGVQGAGSVLDVGCGTGATTVELATRSGGASVVGVDLSRRMLDRAEQRVTPSDPVRFVVADVQSDPLPGGPFDRVFSRFGVMFFPDPVVAFTRIADAMAEGGRMAFVCFKGPEANPFIVVPLLAAAAAHLRLPPMPPPDAPGPFSLADADGLRDLLGTAGLVEVRVEDGPDEAVMRGEDVTTIATRLLEQNPVTGPALRSASPDARRAAVAAAAEAISGHFSGAEVRMDAGTWVVTARKG